MQKSDRQIRIEYLTSETQDEWLQGELTDYFGELAPDGQAEFYGEAALERAEEGMEHFRESVVLETELVSYAVCVIDETAGRDDQQVAFFRSVPSPETLLLYLSKICSTDNKVVVVFTYIDGAQLAFDAVWPFGMDAAVALTSLPDLDALAEDKANAEQFGRGQRLRQFGMSVVARVHVGVDGIMDRFGADTDPVKAAALGVLGGAVMGALLRRRR